MKLVKEILYEKFTEDSDPVHDMGIGIKHFIDNAIENIYEYDSNKIYIKTGSSSNSGIVYKLVSNGVSIQFIQITEGIKKLTFFIKFFSDYYYDKNGVMINKLEYAKELLNHANILKCMEDKVKSEPWDTKNVKDYKYTNWELTFIIKPEYATFFKEGVYYP